MVKKMSYNDRIDAAITEIKQHNEAVGEGNPGFLDADKFIQCVKATGGTSEERLADLSWEDLLVCMPSDPQTGVKPSILAKAIAKIFRVKDKVGPSPFDNRPVSSKKADRMTPKELVEAFDPEDSDNSVGKRLFEISKGQKFIVYSDGRMVDVDSTFKILMEIKAGYPGRDNFDVAGGVKKVYALGELPENYAEENPLYPDRPLRPDGTCDQLGRSWEGVSLPVRQFIRVAINVGDLEVSHETAHDILDIAVGPDNFFKLQSRYRNAAVKFTELSNTNSLPTLKIILGNIGGSEGKSPFDDPKKVVWGYDPTISSNSYCSNISPRNTHPLGVKK